MCAVSGVQDTSTLQYRQLGFILAGGLSSRMGQDKSTVSINGRAMLDIARQLLDTAPLHAHYVLGGPHGTFEEQTTQHGPGRAIADVLLQLAESYTGTALFLPVDMPCLEVQSLEKLLESAKHTQQACFYDNAYFPVAIPISRRFVPILKTLINDKPSAALRAVLACCDARAIPFTGQDKELINVNTRAVAESLSA